MRCHHCGRELADTWPMCSRACADAVAATLRGRTAIGAWDACEMWRTPDGHIHVHVDSGDRLHMRTFYTDAPLRAGDAAELRQWLAAMRGPGGRVDNVTAVARLQRAVDAAAL